MQKEVNFVHSQTRQTLDLIVEIEKASDTELVFDYLAGADVCF